MSRDNRDDYEIGYGKPPIPGRCRRGHSGNPRGRPRGSKNLSTLMDHALKEKVTIKEGDNRKKITKQEAMLKQLVNKAASGDHKSIQLLVALLQQSELRREALAPQESSPEAAYEEMIEGVFERIRTTNISDGGEKSGGE